jgi:hypothetical protein
MLCHYTITAHGSLSSLSDSGLSRSIISKNIRKKSKLYIMEPILYVPWIVLVAVTAVACVVKYINDKKDNN